MTEQELEAQCMAICNLVDTEVVMSDPLKIPSFDFNTLYVWLEPRPNAPDLEHGNMVCGRLGTRDDRADSVAILAKRFGLLRHHS